MKHALGKIPDARHDLWEDLNRAGRALYTEKDWAFRYSGQASLAVVANQAFVQLPDDWAGLLDLYVPSSGTFTQVEVTSLRDIMELRAAANLGYSTGLMRVWFGSGIGQDSKETQPTKRAEIYPTPSTSGEPTMQVFYLRGWVNIKANDNDCIPNLPDAFEEALVCKARAVAWSTENQSPSYDDQKYAAEIQRLNAEEARIQPTNGRMTGGVDRRLASQAFNDRFPRRATL